MSRTAGKALLLCIASDPIEGRHDRLGNLRAPRLRFYSLFDRTLRPEVEAVGKKYVELMQALRAFSDGSCQEVAGQIKQPLDNNARWLRAAGKQFSISVDDLQGLPNPNP